MGFREIIKEWRSNGHDSKADRAQIALDKLRSRSPQIYENLDTDRHISQAKRKELLEQLITANVNDERVVGNRFVSFSHAHQCRGPKWLATRSIHLGHVEERRKTEETLASVVMPTSGLTRRRRSPSVVIDMILRRSLHDQCVLLGETPLSQYEMWSFYQPQAANDPFCGVSKNAGELVRRLGLGHTDPAEELLLWAHQLDSGQSAYVPTAFDAGLYEYYRPGGKTKPLAGDGGLHEVVHSPVVGKQLTHRIEKAL